MVHAPWHQLIESVAVAILVGGGASMLWRARARPPLSIERAPPVRDAWTIDQAVRAIIAAASLGAGAIHLAAAPSHIDELGGLGMGFIGAGLFQIVWAGAYLPAKRLAVVRLGIAVNLVILIAWLWSRTIGLPVGSHPFVPEPVGMPDGWSVIFESIVVTMLLVGTRHGGAAARRLWTPSAAVIAAVPVVGVIFLATVLAVDTAMTTSDHHRPQEHAIEAPEHSHP